MERESFEDERTAALMNEHFVCVKVDREERPDVDAIYMDAVQAMTGHGGWPLNVFLTPDQAPFFGGTYFPPQPRPGLPSWTQVLEAVAEAWATRREEIVGSTAGIAERLSGAARVPVPERQIDAADLDHAVERLAAGYDAQQGGFGGAPKFPPSTVLDFLLRRAAARRDGTAGVEAQMALHTLRAMAAGGIHDQVGGGFSRYAVDATWTVPHFEKMLYDNALLARAYLHGWQVSGDARLLDGGARHLRLGAAGDARPRRRLLRRAGRRLRGGRGAFLRVEHRRARGGARRRCRRRDRVFRGDRGGQLRGVKRPGGPRSASRRAGAGAHPTSACSPRASGAYGPDWTTSA